MLHLQTRLGESDLVQADRELIKEGEVEKISRNAVDTRYLILCNDVLIYAKYSSSVTLVNEDNYGLRSQYRIPLNSLQVEVGITLTKKYQ